jgi:hypothetical protein
MAWSHFGRDPGAAYCAFVRADPRIFRRAVRFVRRMAYDRKMLCRALIAMAGEGIISRFRNRMASLRLSVPETAKAKPHWPRPNPAIRDPSSMRAQDRAQRTRTTLRCLVQSIPLPRRNALKLEDEGKYFVTTRLVLYRHRHHGADGIGAAMLTDDPTLLFISFGLRPGPQARRIDDSGLPDLAQRNSRASARTFSIRLARSF